MALERENGPKCNGCGAVKRETNHWYLLFIRNAGDVQFVAVSEWSEGDLGEADACACGEKCSHMLLSRWFETRTFDAPALRSAPVNPHEVTAERIA